LAKVFVLDNSIVMAWCFREIENAYAHQILEVLMVGKAFVPAIWLLEVGNSILVAERRNRITPGDGPAFLDSLAAMPIQVEPESADRVLGEILDLARKHQLSTYYTSYLDLAMRRKIPLATQDKALTRAAAACGVPLFEP